MTENKGNARNMQNFINAPHRGDTPGVHTSSPNAALLIDFDNVTMGIRSDLTRQMKELLNSDIIRGKVAVQRAYADWRRYAQYIVPLSEASVDLIFAPAYGSSKKNATDIRLAIDALELVFTRPEIGTFILLSGDSDFSSLVLKLKEYGKYVIGVGLRESASDLLVQNCDEYFSYSSLTGLTKAGEEETVSAIDPWDLVERSVNRMADENDVMRSDRLKQVMLDLDPSFDEGQIGYSKFNKFLTEAASRSKLALRRLGNGQYEVQPFADGTAQTERPDRKRGRGGRDSSRSRGRKRPEPPREIKEEKQPRAEAPSAQKPEPDPQPRERKAEDLQHGYELLKRAIRELIEGTDGGARDSDIKRKMLELESGWDESELGFTKFSRFLRQAHDAEVIDLRRTGEGYYEAQLPGGAAPSAPKREQRTERTERTGRTEQPSGRAAQATTPTSTPKAEEKPESRRQEREKREERVTQATPAAEKKPEPKPPAPETEAPAREKVEEKPAAKAEEQPAAKAEEQPAAQGGNGSAAGASRSATYGRRGRRGKAEGGPPPLLPGQVVGGSEGTEKAAPAAEKPAAEKPAAKAERTPVAEPAPEPRKSTAPAVTSPAESKAEDAAPKKAPGAPDLDAEELGFPTERGAVIRYLSNSYQGVGQKTAEALIDAFGEERVFHGLHGNPEKVREILGSGRRTDILLEAWERDYRRRTTAGAADNKS